MQHVATQNRMPFWESSKEWFHKCGISLWFKLVSGSFPHDLDVWNQTISFWWDITLRTVPHSQPCVLKGTKRGAKPRFIETPNWSQCRPGPLALDLTITQKRQITYQLTVVVCWLLFKGKSVRLKSCLIFGVRLSSLPTRNSEKNTRITRTLCLSVCFTVPKVLGKYDLVALASYQGFCSRGGSETLLSELYRAIP